MKQLVHPPFINGSGSAVPFGASWLPDGNYNFAVFMEGGDELALVVRREVGPGKGTHILPLDPDIHRTGSCWHCQIAGIQEGDSYCYQVYRSDEDQARFLADPYGSALLGHWPWGEKSHSRPDPLKLSSLRQEAFDWEEDMSPSIDSSNLVIYELHVRGFSNHPSSGVDKPGTYSGLIEKIPHLKRLGINCVELLPVYEFDELDNHRSNPSRKGRLFNYWGYQPLNFFTPKRAYSSSGSHTEFKELVKSLHREGIKVILDVVYNHTGEGSSQAPPHSLRGLAEREYFLISANDEYLNYSGCGNTFNANSPIGQELIINSLRHWVSEYHVDGFRFDLASILTRGPDGAVLEHPPVIAAMNKDPVLADVLLIAEAWDAAGLYQLGQFGYGGRWYEWNGRFRDDVRDYVRGKPGSLSSLASRLTGSADLFKSPRNSRHSINFVTCHDGFTLRDLVSYNQKHNEWNGEENRDGESHNRSWNCGTEGETADEAIRGLRFRQVKNFLGILFLSRGTPMLLAGDELYRTQGGNNNAYCQDNEVSWIDWTDTREKSELTKFVRSLISFRQANPLLNVEAGEEADGDQVGYTWHGYRLDEAHWSEDSYWLGLQIEGSVGGAEQSALYLMFNNGTEEQEFELPELSKGLAWSEVFNTAKSCTSYWDDANGQTTITDQRLYALEAYSVVVLAAKPVS